MRLTIEIAAAALLVVCISATSAALPTARPARGRRLELFLQRRERRFARSALCRDQAAMRRKILRQLLRRQVAVGDVKGSSLTVHAVVPTQSGILPSPGWR
jgi:hypothetical protein